MNIKLYVYSAKKTARHVVKDITSWIRYVVTDFFRVFKISTGYHYCTYFIYGAL